MRKIYFGLCFGLALFMLGMHIADAQQKKGGAEARGQPTKLQILEANPPRDLAAGAEFIVVSGMRAEESAASRVRVEIDRPGKTIILVISSYDDVAWLIDAKPQTTVLAILIGVDGTESTVSSNVATKVYAPGIPLISRPEPNQHNKMIDKLGEIFGVTKIDVLRYGPTLAATVRIGLGN